MIEITEKPISPRLVVSHRVGKLRVGEINLVVAIASAHRTEGFVACQYVIEQFKERLPTRKVETYQNGGVRKAFQEAME